MGSVISAGGISPAELRSRMTQGLADFRFDHYLHYPASRPDAWQDLLLSRVDSLLASGDSTLFWSADDRGESLVAARVSAWDAEHFGFPTAGVQVVYTRGSYGGSLRLAFDDCIAALSDRQVAFVSARIHGDQLEAIHHFESNHFRYYENIVWPVVSTATVAGSPNDAAVRLMTEADLAAVVRIAEQHQYPRGHFHCDPGFAPGAVDPMYGKWVRSAWERKQPVLVVDFDGSAAGYFALEMSEGTSKSLGYRYAGMRSLGLDARARGQGLGIALFRGALSWMKTQGAEYVDSGYATKNHVSAKLHVRTGFTSVYEEVTLHRWLKAPPLQAQV